MKRVLAVLIVVMVLIALWLWNVGRSSPATSVDSNSGAQTDPSRTNLASEPAMSVAPRPDAQRTGASVTPTPSTAAVSTDTLTIRSSVGLPLPFVEVEQAAGEWLETVLDNGICARSLITNALRVRGPGHVATAVVPDAKEIVLEPDALLVIESETLRACTRAIEPRDPYTDPGTGEPLLRFGLRHAIAFGWLSDKKWALALTPDRLEEGYRGECEIHLHWRDERMARITFHGASGCRESWTVDCEQRVQGLPLVVRVVRPAGLPTGPVDLALDRLTHGDTTGRTLRFPWGRVDVDDDELHLLRRVDAASSEFLFDFVPTDTRLSLAARDQVSSAYARSKFIHDGSQRTLLLSPPFRLTGRLIPPEGVGLPSHGDMTAEGFEGKEEIAQWGLGKQGVVIDAAGAFLLTGPALLLRWENAQLEVPSRMDVSLMVPGFEPWQGSFETHHAPDLDCGDIHLTARAAEVVLAPGHGLVVKSVKWEGLITPGEAQSIWNIRDAVLQADGSMQIVLRRDEKDPDLLSTWPGVARAWPSPPPEVLMIHVIMKDGDWPMAFERDGHGRYAAVPTRLRDLDFDFRQPADHARWLVGWEWRGIADVCEAIDPMQFGEMVHLHVPAPEQGVTLSWTTDWEHRLDAGTRGGSAPIDTVRAPIALH